MIDPDYHKRLEETVSDLEEQVSTLRGAYLKASNENKKLREESFHKLSAGMVPKSSDEMQIVIAGCAGVGKSIMGQLISSLLKSEGLDGEFIGDSVFMDESFIKMGLEKMRSRGIRVNVIERQIPIKSLK